MNIAQSSHCSLCIVHCSFLPDSPTRVLARRFVGALRSRGSLAVLARAVTGFAPTGNAQMNIAQ
jgi:hypothetical protein